MHQQDVSRRQIDQEVFGAAADTGDALASQPLGKVLRQWPAQIRPANLHPREAFAVHGRFKAAANRFDFRKLGH